MKMLNQLLFAGLIAGILLSGCSKRLENSNSKLSVQSQNSQDPLVATPGGLMPSSHVHLVENGYQLSVKGGHVLKINKKTGEVAEDLGEYAPKSGNADVSLLVPGLVKVSQQSWVAWLQWDNSSSSPINYFSTSWIVPNNPSVYNNQLIYIYNALTDAAGTVDIMQPVLQWGSGPAGGGNGWAIANWYVWSSGSAHSDLISVNPGTNLQGIIQLIGQNTDGTYNYTSSFAGYNNGISISEGDVVNGSTIPGVPVQAAAFETLEAFHTVNGTHEFGIGSASEYPANTDMVVMNSIALSLTSGYPYESIIVNRKLEKTYAISWTPGKLAASVGESALAVNGNDEGQGQTYLYFQTPTINGAGIVSISLLNPDVSCVITACPGATVTVHINIAGVGGGEGTGAFTITTPGVTFTGGSNTISVTNGDIYQTFIMPAAGSITGTATFAQVTGSASGGVAVL